MISLFLYTRFNVGIRCTPAFRTAFKRVCNSRPLHALFIVCRGREGCLPFGCQRRRSAEGLAEAQDQGRKRVRHPGSYQGPGTSSQRILRSSLILASTNSIFVSAFLSCCSTNQYVQSCSAVLVPIASVPGPHYAIFFCVTSTLFPLQVLPVPPSTVFACYLFP